VVKKIADFTAMYNRTKHLLKGYFDSNGIRKYRFRTYRGAE
jgi:hypothetical protein